MEIDFHLQTPQLQSKLTCPAYSISLGLWVAAPVLRCFCNKVLHFHFNKYPPSREAPVSSCFIFFSSCSLQSHVVFWTSTHLYLQHLLTSDWSDLLTIDWSDRLLSILILTACVLSEYSCSTLTAALACLTALNVHNCACFAHMRKIRPLAVTICVSPCVYAFTLVISGG